MNTFTTITEKELLNAAYYHILQKWVNHIDRNEEYQKAHNGKSNSIDKHWIDAYSKQLDELHEAILKLEQSGIAE